VSNFRLSPNSELRSGKLYINDAESDLNHCENFCAILFQTQAILSEFFVVALPDDTSDFDAQAVISEKTVSPFDDFVYNVNRLRIANSKDARAPSLRVLQWLMFAKLVLELKPELEISVEAKQTILFLTSYPSVKSAFTSRADFELEMDWLQWSASVEALEDSMLETSSRAKPKSLRTMWEVTIPWPENIGVDLGGVVAQLDHVLTLGYDVRIFEGEVTLERRGLSIKLQDCGVWLSQWISKFPSSSTQDVGFSVQHRGEQCGIRAEMSDLGYQKCYSFRIIKDRPIL
jgi:hypothetical protein